MKTTVVGSFPFKLQQAHTFKDKLKNSFGSYDPYKLAIYDVVNAELDAGIDIVADGGVRENINMVNIFTKHMGGMAVENGTSVIKSKIMPPYNNIVVDDVNTASKALDDYILNHELTEEEIKNKAVKAVVTGPSTIIYSSMIESFYKNKDDAIIDYAHAFKGELSSIENKTSADYIQIDEPFLSTGMVDLKVASEAIDILTEDLELYVAMHVCGNISNVFKDIAKFNVQMLDLEFAGNHSNLDVVEKNISKLKGKKVGFGCLDSSVDEIDSKVDTRKLIERGIKVIGKENMVLDPDCGLGKLSEDVAFKKLQLMCNLNKEFN